ncbi:unnamed protein product, partial [Scytosiphon promiscuus]
GRGTCRPTPWSSSGTKRKTPRSRGSCCRRLVASSGAAATEVGRLRTSFTGSACTANGVACSGCEHVSQDEKKAFGGGRGPSEEACRCSGAAAATLADCSGLYMLAKESTVEGWGEIGVAMDVVERMSSARRVQSGGWRGN